MKSFVDFSAGYPSLSFFCNTRLNYYTIKIVRGFMISRGSLGVAVVKDLSTPNPKEPFKRLSW